MERSIFRSGGVIRRALIGLALVIVLLTLLVLAGGAVLWQQVKRDQGIQQLDLQGVSLGPTHLRVDRLTLEGDPAVRTLNLTASNLRLAWGFAGGLHLKTLQVQHLRGAWQPAQQPTEANPASLQVSRPDPRAFLPGWLPRTLTIEQFDLRLPCAAGTCPLTGQVALQHGGSAARPATLALALHRAARTLQFDTQVSGPAEQPDLSARLRIDEQTRLSLTSIFREQASGGVWSGHLSLPSLPEAPWLLAWLEQWSGPQPRLQGAADLQLQADWDWQLAPGPLDATQLRSLSGHINLDGNLPTPWPLPGIGQLQGSAALQVRADAGQWSANRLQADFTVEHLEPALLAALPAGLRPSAMRLQLQQPDQPASAGGGLPLKVRMSSSGALQLNAEADLQLSPSPQVWWLQVDSSRIRASAARLQLPALQGRALQLDARASGRVDAQGFAFSLDKASSLGAAELLVSSAEAPIRFNALTLDRAALTLSGPLPGSAPLRLAISGPARLRAEQILHPAVHPLGWSWEGQLSADPQRQQLKGTLGNSAGLNGQVQLNRTADALDISATLPDSFLRSGNPLAATLSAWPALLELNNGRLQLNAHLSLAAQGTLTARADARLQGVSGLYDRTEFSGLNAQLNLQLAAAQLRVTASGLTLQQANPGIAIGPLQFEGEYRAALAQLSAGQLDWRRARSALLGGELWLEPGSLRLGQESVFPVHIRGLQLQELFRAYPAEGLSGRGTLDGLLPLGIGPAGVRIVQGRLAARAPGGQLQFNSPKISALGRSNPAMQVVADALADFHYDSLSSGVDYDAQGTLRLALKLEGRNPDVERGRPINFSINLEEDIPALLTSLQLTGRVSDRVRERVQQQMEQSQPTP